MSGSDEDQRATVAERPRHGKPSTRVEPGDGEDFAESLPTGTMADRYVLLGRLGAGGAGLVYSAYDPQLDRKVAIKLLRGTDDGETDSSHGRARLLREAQAMARLKHPNILPVYDVGTLQHPLGSRVFMAMELVEGGTLRQWLKQPHSRREILDVMISCGRGLAAAHAAGMVHRDFKPSNVLIDDARRVFVTDFGLVRAAGSDEVLPAHRDSSPPRSLTNPLTAIGAVVGTPGYMAPEQYRPQPLDARSDQFSYCLTLCEALCGKRLVDGDTMKELEAATLGADFAGALRDAKVPSWLARVILRGLERERDARYPTMDELLAALRNDPTQRARRWLLVATGALVLAGGTTFAVHHFSERPAELCGGSERALDGVWDGTVRARVSQGFERAGAGPSFANVAAVLDTYAHDLTAERREACEATRVRGEQPDSVLALRMSCLDTRRKELAALSSLLADADKATVRDAVQLASKLSSIRGCEDIAALTAPVPPPADPKARASVEALRARLAEGKVLAGAARYPAARAIVDEVVRGEAAIHYGPLRAEALELLAGLQREQDGEMKAARATLVDAISAAYASHDDSRAASTMTALAMLDSYWLGEHESAQRWVQLARAAIERMGGSDELEAERARVEAEIWIGEEKGAPAVAAAEPAMRLAEKVYGAASVQAADFHATLGAAHSTNGNTVLARQNYEAQRTILEKLVGPDHPLVAMALNNLGLNAEAEGRLDEAERDYRASVSILERALGADHPRVAIALSNLGAALRSANKPAEALAAFQRALEINDKRFGTSYPDSLDALLGTGEALVALGRSAEAFPALERALHFVETSDSSAWGLAEARFAMAEALWDSGRDRDRARHLAAAAHAGMADVHNAMAGKLGVEIDAWIAAHR